MLKCSGSSKDPLGNFEADPVLDFVGSILGGITDELHG